MGTVNDGVAQLTRSAEEADGRTLQADDGAARLLFMYGRRPTDGSRLHSTIPDEDFVWMARLCAGY